MDRSDVTPKKDAGSRARAEENLFTVYAAKKKQQGELVPRRFLLLSVPEGSNEKKSVNN